jgi:hypothetical protein
MSNSANDSPSKTVIKEQSLKEASLKEPSLKEQSSKEPSSKEPSSKEPSSPSSKEPSSKEQVPKDKILGKQLIDKLTEQNTVNLEIMNKIPEEHKKFFENMLIDYGSFMAHWDDPSTKYSWNILNKSLFFNQFQVFIKMANFILRKSIIALSKEPTTDTKDSTANHGNISPTIDTESIFLRAQKFSSDFDGLWETDEVKAKEILQSFLTDAELQTLETVTEQQSKFFDSMSSEYSLFMIGWLQHANKQSLKINNLLSFFEQMIASIRLMTSALIVAPSPNPNIHATEKPSSSLNEPD